MFSACEPLVQNCSSLILVEKKNAGHFVSVYLELGLVSFAI
jgi:hypothetical protein